MAKRKTGYAAGVVFCLSLLLTALLSLAAPIQNISTAQSPTWTPSSPEQIEAINQLIRDETCQLPCWWGLTLKESRVAEVKARLIEIFGRENISLFKGNTYIRIGSNLTFITEDYPDPEWLDMEGYRFSFDAWTSVANNQLVGIALRIPLPQYHKVDWTPYTAKSILSRFGEPDDIAYLEPIMNGDCCINLIFRYYDLGLYVEYSIEATYAQNQHTFCNTIDDIAYDGIIILLEAEELQFKNFGIMETVRHKDPYELEIDRVTNLTRTEFTELFSQENACITVTY